MPIKYIGRKIDFKGKPLWEILANLKNFGVGRLVVRNMFQRYPEPCYMRILKVAAVPPTNRGPLDARKVMVLVEKTFRGVTTPKPIQVYSASYKADYALIPKDEESRYTQSCQERPATVLMPNTLHFPPLLREILIRRTKKEGDTTEEPRMKAVYNKSGVKHYRIADEGEEPTVQIPIDVGTPVAPRLYANINRKELS